MSLQACADLVARGDPDRFRATMAAPVEARRVLFPLYAFNIEVSRAPWVTEEPLIAEMRLQFWRDVVEELAAGKPPRAHEVAVPLAEAIPADLVSVLDPLIVARQWDIYREPFADRAGFDAYIADTSGRLAVVAGRALGAPEGAAGVLADAGWAMGLASFLRAIPSLEAAGRVPLVEGTGEAVSALAGEGLARLTRARAARATVPRVATPAVFLAGQAAAVLEAAQAAPERVAAGALPEPALAARLSLARAALTGRW